MGRPVFRVFHNMIPVWIAVLKLLKKAPKSLPSIRLPESGGPHLLLQAFQCGDLQTESFRYEKPTLKRIMQCSSRPRTDSFRVVNPLAFPCSGLHASSDSDFSFTTAPSSLAAEADSPSRSSTELHDLSLNIDKTTPSPASGPAITPHGAAPVRDDDRSCYAIAAQSPESQQQSEEEPEADAPAAADFHECVADRGEPAAEIINAAADFHECVGEPAAKITRKTDLRRPRAQNKHRSRAAGCRRGSSRSSSSVKLSACSDQIVKNSYDPYGDFVASIKEMIVANNLRAYEDLEDLFCCYLELNAPKHHQIITLAFLQAMADLRIASSKH